MCGVGISGEKNSTSQDRVAELLSREGGAQFPWRKVGPIGVLGLHWKPLECRESCPVAEAATLVYRRIPWGTHSLSGSDDGGWREALVLHVKRERQVIFEAGHPVITLTQTF